MPGEEPASREAGQTVWRCPFDPSMNSAALPYLLAFSTCPDRSTARRIAGALVEARLAACVNVVEGVTSVYEWKEALQEDAECLLLIKTRAERFEALREMLVRLHPYELPELVAVPLAAGLPGYLEWIDTCVKDGS
jgi:periplasmic divalent cation tolerance protein